MQQQIIFEQRAQPADGPMPKRRKLNLSNHHATMVGIEYM
jgi:hypothetical protein